MLTNGGGGGITEKRPIKYLTNKGLEAAGVEHENGNFSAVVQLIDGARVVVATRSWSAA